MVAIEKGESLTMPDEVKVRILWGLERRRPFKLKGKSFSFSCRGFKQGDVFGAITLGRSPNNDVKLEELGTVSRNHGLILFWYDGVSVRMGYLDTSSNGTFVDDRLVSNNKEPFLLKKESVLKIPTPREDELFYSLFFA